MSSLNKNIQMWGLFLSLWFAALVAHAQPWAVHEVEPAGGSQPPMTYIEDVHSRFTLADVRSPEYRKHWRPLGDKTPNFGYTLSTYWFRIDLHNPNPQQVSKLLVVNAPFLDHIEYYLFRGDEQVQSFVTGDKYRFSQRLIAHPQFLFPLELESGANYSLIFRVQTSGSMEFPATLWEERDFYLQDSVQIQIHSIYYGVLLFVIFFNLFVFLTLKERTYLYYVLSNLSILLIQATLHARAFEHIWPDLPELQYLILQFAIPVELVFSTLFARHFLNLDQNHPRIAMIFKVLTGLGALSLVLAFFLPYAYATRIALALTFPTALVLLTVGPLLWWRGVAEARYYTIAWAVLQIGASLTILYKTGVIPATFFSVYGLQLGSAMEAVLLSMAIADRVYRERSDRVRAQERILREIEERRLIEQRLLEQATHSAVTGLPNRVLFENRMAPLIQQHMDQQFLVCLIHLSRFHEIDKTLGHDNADRLLQQVGREFNDFCSTLEGIVLLEKTPQGQRHYLANFEGVTLALLLRQRGPIGPEETRIARLAEVVSSPVQLNHLTLDLGAQIGVAQFPFHARTTDGLIRKAQIALDHASGDNIRVSCYSRDLDFYNERRLTLMSELDKAIRQDALELHFQPQLSLKTQQVVGVETLLRWRHPEHGMIPPDEFVVLAERTGLITPLTRWVLKHTLLARAQLLQAGLNCHFSINISAMNLRETDFALEVSELLRKHRVAPRDITLELTETAMMSNPTQARRELAKLSQIGIRLSIDDFGAGYSSLSYIKRLPLDEIKIDKSLIFDLTTKPDDQIIVKTTVEMCHNLGYQVVAEGVENQEIMDILDSLGCDIIQGYYLARPMPLAALIDWLSQRQGANARSTQSAG